MSDPKNEAFHRLATKRADTITDAIRVFSNLSSANYNWTPDEVTTYFTRLQAALDGALTCFTSQPKRWHLEVPEREVSAPSDPEPTSIVTVREHSASELAALARASPPMPRMPTITEVIREAGNSLETLAEMIVLQRQVIERMQK